MLFPKTSKNICEKYKEITVPTVIAVGKEDPFGTKKDILCAIYKVIPDIGHMIPTLHPQIVMENIDVISKIKTSFHK